MGDEGEGVYDGMYEILQTTKMVYYTKLFS